MGDLPKMTILGVPPWGPPKIFEFFLARPKAQSPLHKFWVTYFEYPLLLGTKSVKMAIFGLTPRPKSTKFYNFFNSLLHPPKVP